MSKEKQGAVEHSLATLIGAKLMLTALNRGKCRDIPSQTPRIGILTGLDLKSHHYEMESGVICSDTKSLECKPHHRFLFHEP